MPPQRTPSILMVSYQYAPFVDGGAERQAQRQAEELARRGWRVGVATARYPGLPRRELINGVEVALGDLPAFARGLPDDDRTLL